MRRGQHQTSIVSADYPPAVTPEQEIFDPPHYLPLLEQRPGAFYHARSLRRWRQACPPLYEQLLARLQQDTSQGSALLAHAQPQQDGYKIRPLRLTKQPTEAAQKPAQSLTQAHNRQTHRAHLAGLVC